MPDPTSLLTVDGLRSGYGGKPVLQGVDLSVRDREVTAVIGRNGVGKSTLMKAVIGLLPATDGTIRIQRRGHRRRDAACPREAGHRLCPAGARRVPAHER